LKTRGWIGDTADPVLAECTIAIRAAVTALLSKERNRRVELVEDCVRRTVNGFAAEWVKRRPLTLVTVSLVDEVGDCV
jgi:mRNA degradation ribonuclease J1/J2